MTIQHRQSAVAPLWERLADPRRLLSALSFYRARRPDSGFSIPVYRHFFAEHGRLIRRGGIALAVLVVLLTGGAAGLWWRLASGPIQFDVATPWLAAAIEENFGSGHHVEVGGTQIEHTESGGTAVRIRDIVVRDADGTVVASAPKAEVRVSGMSLLSGHMRAESLNLVGAEMAVRIERDGQVTIFAGADKRPIATAAVPASAAAALLRSAQNRGGAEPPPTAAAAPTLPNAQGAAQPAPSHRTRDVFAALLSWIDGIGETGLDGHDLGGLGLKNGNLTVDDERTGKHWAFRDINLSAERVHGGGVEVAVGSDNPERPWVLRAAVAPSRQGFRKFQLEAHRVSIGDLLLASRLDDRSIKIDTPLSGNVSGEIGPDG